MTTKRQKELGTRGRQ